MSIRLLHIGMQWDDGLKGFWSEASMTVSQPALAATQLLNLSPLHTSTIHVLMSLQALPHELLTIIAKEPVVKDMNALLQSSSFLYDSLNPYFYACNVKQHSESALISAAKHGSEGTLQRFPDAGANIR
ncbi:hypothetical protein BDV10DRAFT_187882 [Aspergillus recurvatus]